jgi:hypothetical protein
MTSQHPAVAAPTDRWLAAAPDLPPLDGPYGTAERLLLLVHYGIDWQDGWLRTPKHRGTYWDRILPDRVLTAAYRAPTLRRWWQDAASELDSAPRTAAERAELERLLRADSTPVLEVFRWETDALILRTRITADAVRESRAAAAEEEPQP